MERRTKVPGDRFRLRVPVLLHRELRRISRKLFQRHFLSFFLFFRISTSPENSRIFINQHLSTTRPVGIDKLIIRFAVEETANLIAAFISPLCELISTVRYLAKMAR